MAEALITDGTQPWLGNGFRDLQRIEWTPEGAFVLARSRDRRTAQRHLNSSRLRDRILASAIYDI